MYKIIVNFQVLLERDTNITDIKRLKQRLKHRNGNKVASYHVQR